MATYPYVVKCNGEYYEAGGNVPENKAAAVNEPLPFSDSDIALETGTDKQYTKTDIQRMSKEELIEMANGMSIEGADSMTGTKLKEILLTMLGL